VYTTGPIVVSRDYLITFQHVFLQQLDMDSCSSASWLRHHSSKKHAGFQNLNCHPFEPQSYFLCNIL